MSKTFLYQVFGSIVLAIVVGLSINTLSINSQASWIQFFDFLGTLFLNALKLVVIPLVAASIITGAARVGADHSFKSLGLKTFCVFVCNLLLAILIGFAFVTLLSPGVDLSFADATHVENLSVAALEQATHLNHFAKIAQVFYHLIPSNIILAAAEGKLLGVIFFCMLFGYFINQINGQAALVVVQFWQGVFEIMMKITHLIMKALPVGVFGLVASVVAKSGLDSFVSIIWFVATVLLALTTYGFIVLPLILKMIGQCNPFAHLKAMAPALFTAFTTSSSAASLPVTLECLEEKAGVSNRVCSFVIPLGATINLAASALYVCVSVLFIAQVYQVPITLSTQLMVIFMSFLLAFGTAGIPSGCLISVLAILQSMGIPAEAIGMLWAVERVLDMYRSSLNVFGNTCCAVLVARFNGEKGALKFYVGS